MSFIITYLLLCFRINAWVVLISPSTQPSMVSAKVSALVENIISWAKKIIRTQSHINSSWFLKFWTASRAPPFAASAFYLRIVACLANLEWFCMVRLAYRNALSRSISRLTPFSTSRDVYHGNELALNVEVHSCFNLLFFNFFSFSCFLHKVNIRAQSVHLLITVLNVCLNSLRKMAYVHIQE